MTRVLIITGATLGARMSGPAIRALAMARVLANDGHQVVLASTMGLDEEAITAGSTVVPSIRLVRLEPGDHRAFARWERHTDVIVFQGQAMQQFPALSRTDRVVVADAYDPLHLEMLEHGRGEPREHWEHLVSHGVTLLNQQLGRADVVLCASERQRMLYLGHLASLGRISPVTYSNDPLAKQLLAVVPFGLDPQPPAATGPALRHVVDGVDDDSRIVLWGGGLYSWFDPLTLIRAVHSLATRRPHTTLVFLGTKTPGIEPMGIVKESIDLARKLGAEGRSVIFNENWVPFDERGSYYLEANAGVSTHHVHLETEFSFRTRILDYLWAGLPMVVTEGDTFADLVRDRGLGVVVPPNDEQALIDALDRVLYDEEFAQQCRDAVATVRDMFTWERTLEPLREVANNPRHAADVEAAGSRDRLARSLRAVHKRPLPPGLRHDLRKALHYWRTFGADGVRERIAFRRSLR